MRKALLVGSSALTLLLLASPAFAGFATAAVGINGGSASIVSPPPTALGDISTAYHVWNEQNNITSGSDISLDNNGAPGSYSGLSPGTPGTISAGTSFGTTFVQLNPDAEGIIHSGSVVIDFSSKVLGVALSGTTGGVPGTLDNTDTFGAPGTAYPTGYTNSDNNRGILNKTNQFFTISASGTEITIQLTANMGGFKELRIFTAGGASGVPEPASLIIWSVLGTFVAGGARWRRNRPAV